MGEEKDDFTSVRIQEEGQVDSIDRDIVLGGVYSVTGSEAIPSSLAIRNDDGQPYGMEPHRFEGDDVVSYLKEIATQGE